MAGQTNLAVRIATIFDAAGIKKADKAIGGLQKTTSKLGKTLGIALSVATVTAFGKASVKAFADDQKSAQMLTVAIKNLGLAFAQANIDKFIDDLEGISAIADDTLRPAFQALLTTTGSVTKSQELLRNAIEISRGSGVALSVVVDDLSKGYVGITKGLEKYKTGLTRAQLSAMSFEEIMATLNKQFDGSSAAYLETYAGKMEAITTAVGSAQEAIGESLVNALMTLSGASNTTELITYIEKVGERIANLITSVEKFGFLLKFWFNPKNWLKKGDAGIKEWEEVLRKRAYAAGKPFDPKNNSLTGFKVDQAAADKAARDAARRQKELLAAQNKNTAELKKQNALKKAGTIFDLTQIQIIAALKGKVSAEEKKRLELQLALATENVDLVAQLTKEIALSQGLGKDLATFLADLPNAKNPFEAWKSFLDEIEAQASRIAMMGSLSSLYGTPVPNFTPTLTGSFPDTTSPSFIGPKVPDTIVVNVGGSVVTSQSLIDEIRGGLNVAALSGSSANVERRIGGW